MAAERREQGAEATLAPGRNEVRLVGRLAAVALERELPSGDRLMTWRLVVRRPPSSRSGAPTVDTIECAAYRGDVRRAAARWAADDLLEVDGALRRRFWRTGGGAASRTEVEVSAARRVGRG